MRFKLIMSLFCAAIIFTSKLSACTGILLNSTNNSIVTGRTVEFATPLSMSIAVIPRNFQFVGKTSIGNGLTYKAKYAAVGIDCFNNNILMDGINEKGLVAAAFFFPGYAGYTPTTPENQNCSLSPVDFTNWILTQFSSIDEVLAALPSVTISPTVIKGWGSSAPPFHYVIYDSSGKSIVIEPLNGKLVTYQNLVGSFTNSPTFDWHVTNLANYINLSTLNAKPMKLRGLDLQVYGQGSGLNGLPGGFSSTSRFVRASIFSANSVPPINAADLPNKAFHVLNQFDIPVGSVRSDSQGSINYDRTQVTTVKDPNTLRYYYKSYADQNIKFVDLNKLNLDAGVIQNMLIQGDQVNLDVSCQL